eukprot:15344729-Ditylum_brightwellii.AAC.1
MNHKAAINPLNYAYKALETHITPLEQDSIESKCIQKYIDNTYGSDDVDVHQIFSINDGKTASDIPKKCILFYRSKNENIIGILKNVLLIAPPVASSTGWNYGKGIYFSDQFPKDFGYASPFGSDGSDGGHPRSFIFVAEVTLDESYLLIGLKYMEKPPLGTDLTHALGRDKPNPNKKLMLDELGVTIPFGYLQPIKVPGQTKSVWKRSRWQYLEDKTCMKIEEKQLDPVTIYLATINFQDNGEEKEVILKHGPESKIAKGEEDADRGKEKGGSGGELKTIILAK